MMTWSIFFSDDEDLRNICSWLGEYEAKALWIETENDCMADSIVQKKVPFVYDVKEIKDIKEKKTYSKIDSLAERLPEKGGRCEEAHVVQEVIEDGGENVEDNKFETTGDYGGEVTGENSNLALEKEKDTESISDVKEGEVDNLVEKEKERQPEEDFDVVVEGDEEEEEYYLIEEEIIEEGEEDEADTGEGECRPTGKDSKEDEEHREVVKKQCKRKEYEVFVGGLHRCATREEIDEVFSKVGEVKSVRMARDRWSKKNRGYAFVQYGTVEQARHALAELKSPVVCSL